MRSIEELSYEEALAELESIVQSLENEPHSLDESLRLFERGQALLQRCRRLLEEAELKVQQITGTNLSAFEEEGGE